MWMSLASIQCPAPEVRFSLLTMRWLSGASSRCAWILPDISFTKRCPAGQALGAVVQIQPDLIILDLGLPDMDGGDVVSRVRESNQCPILILSVRGQESEKAAVLDMGADDYLTKPFGTRELLARVRALLRRSAGPGLIREVKCGRLSLDPGRRSALLEGDEIRLSRTEYGLLKCLAPATRQYRHTSPTCQGGMGRLIQRKRVALVACHGKQFEAQD